MEFNFLYSFIVDKMNDSPKVFSYIKHHFSKFNVKTDDIKKCCHIVHTFNQCDITLLFKVLLLFKESTVLLVH